MQIDKAIKTSKILIVDDDAVMRMVLRTIFEQEGFSNITEAVNGQEGWEKTLALLPDIVFLDINMPEVEGDTLFELIRAFHQNVKVVISSVYPMEEQKERIKDADAYFDKSDSQDSLLEIVSSLN